MLNYDEWTPDIVKARQKKLIDTYKKGWDLKESKVDAVIDNAAIQVIKTISENDIRARILRIPAKIKTEFWIKSPAFSAMWEFPSPLSGSVSC